MSQSMVSDTPASAMEPATRASLAIAAVGDAWRVLAAIRRYTSSTSPWRSYQRLGDELWYTTTESMDADILEIDVNVNTFLADVF